MKKSGCILVLSLLYAGIFAAPASAPAAENDSVKEKGIDIGISGTLLNPSSPVNSINLIVYQSADSTEAAVGTVYQPVCFDCGVNFGYTASSRPIRTGILLGYRSGSTIHFPPQNTYKITLSAGEFFFKPSVEYAGNYGYFGTGSGFGFGSGSLEFVAGKVKTSYTVSLFSFEWTLRAGLKKRFGERFAGYAGLELPLVSLNMLDATGVDSGWDKNLTSFDLPRLEAGVSVVF